MEQLSFRDSVFNETQEASHADASDALTMRGNIERVVFFNEDTGECLLDVRLPTQPKSLLITTRTAQVWPGQSFVANRNSKMAESLIPNIHSRRGSSSCPRRATRPASPRSS